MDLILRRAWLATAVWFALNAFGYASFIVRIPEVKTTFGLSNSNLGFILFSASLGALGAIKLGGKWSARFGSSPVMVLAAIVGAGIFPILGGLQSVLVFALSLMAIVFALTTMDIAMNAHAVTIEQTSGKMIMGRLHAMWSIGGILGGLAGGLFVAAQISLFQHTAFISGAMIVMVFGFRKLLLPGSADIHELTETKSDKIKTPPILYLLGFIGLSAAIIEGAAADWGAVLVAEEYFATGFAVSLPYVVFQTGMVIGRINGDQIAEKFGRSTVLFISGLIASLGLTAGLIIGGIPATIFAWLCLGLGASVVIPMAFSSAGAIATHQYPGKIAPSQAVATVSGIAYAAFFIGPPVIGLLADASSLRFAMVLPALLALGIVFGSRLLAKNLNSRP